MTQEHITTNNAIALAQSQRQLLFSTLAKSSLEDIQQIWSNSIDAIDYEFIRRPEVGMVMAVARTGMTGEPFNLGEVTVTRCAIKLDSGETGFGYVQGRNKKHSTHIAVIDALAQKQECRSELFSQLIDPLQKINHEKRHQQQVHSDKTKVDFFTMVRGESEND